MRSSHFIVSNRRLLLCSPVDLGTKGCREFTGGLIVLLVPALFLGVPVPLV